MNNNQNDHFALVLLPEIQHAHTKIARERVLAKMVEALVIMQPAQAAFPSRLFMSSFVPGGSVQRCYGVVGMHPARTTTTP